MRLRKPGRRKKTLLIDDPRALKCLLANLSSFVLGYFMLGMLLAILALAVGAAGFRNVDLGIRIVSNGSLKI